MDAHARPPARRAVRQLVDEATIAELNEQWMDEGRPDRRAGLPDGRAAPGPVDEEPEEGVLGDLVLCPAVAAAAGRRGRARHAGTRLHLLTVHGVLHLLGYDHAEPDEHKEMFGLQASCSLSGVARPGAGTP